MWIVLLLAVLGVAVRGEQCIGAGVISDQFNKCYHFVTSPQTYEEAVEVCKGFGGTLVCLHNAFEQTLVYGNGKQQLGSQDYWIGLSDLEQPGKWEWVDHEASSYYNWDSGKPDNSSSYRCVSVNIKNGRWYNVECDATKKMFVCEVATLASDPNSECPGSGPAYGGRSCFYYVDSLQSRSEAEATCASFKGLLASVETEEKQNFFYSAAREKILRGDYWIGLRMAVNTSKWWWSDSSKYSYKNWEAGFPITGADMNCGAIQSKDGKWYNTFCDDSDNKRVFACEIVSALAPPTTPGTTTTEVPIDPYGWTYFPPTDSYYKLLAYEDYYYYYYTDWADIREMCEYMDADLASIHNDDENDFVTRIVEEVSDVANCWIGLETTDGYSWIWSDGTPMDYRAWMAGAPDSNPNNMCGTIDSSSYWSNFDCNDQELSALCKRSGSETERIRLRARREKRREMKKKLKFQKNRFLSKHSLKH